MPGCEFGFFPSQSDHPSIDNGIKSLSREVPGDSFFVVVFILFEGAQYYYKAFTLLSTKVVDSNVCKS